MKHENSEFSIDPQLAALFDLIRETPERNPAAITRSREKFLSELDQLNTGPIKSIIPSFNIASDLSLLEWFERRFGMTGKFTRLSVAALAVILVLGLSLFGGVRLTARASEGALPGDALYPVKLQLEQAELTLARDLSREAELNMLFASRRLEEIKLLVQAGRYDTAVELADEFHGYIAKALEKVDELSALDPAMASQLNVEINTQLNEYLKELVVILSNLPEPYRLQIEGGLPIIPPVQQGNENGNTNGNINGNENGNTNGNTNGNENGNTNGNTNGNINGNENGNTNGNENANINGNENGNTNGNENDDDDANENDDDDANENDDDDNDNDNDDNDNDDDDDNDNDDDDDNDNDDDDDNENGDDDD